MLSAVRHACRAASSQASTSTSMVAACRPKLAGLGRASAERPRSSAMPSCFTRQIFTSSARLMATASEAAAAATPRQDGTNDTGRGRVGNPRRAKKTYTLESQDPAVPSEKGSLQRHKEFPHLPAAEHWNDVFSAGVGFTRNRTFVRDSQLAERIIASLKLDEVDGKITIVEGYPGPGILTRLLLQHPKVEKVIAMDDNKTYVPCLESLATDATLTEDERSKLLIEDRNPYRWEAHTNAISKGGFDHLQGKLPGDAEGEDTIDVKAISKGQASSLRKHDTASWRAKPQILFLAQLPNVVHSEQLFAQLCHAIAHRQWYFQFTRVQMAYICSQSLANRALAVPGTKARAKLGAIVQCLADVSRLLPSSEFAPHAAKIFPSTHARDPAVIEREMDKKEKMMKGGSIALSASLSKRNTSMILVQPKLEPLVGHGQLDALEYITRNVFVLRLKPVGHALKHVAPGAENLLQHLQADSEETRGHPERIIEPHTIVSELTNEQWAALARVFDNWPFRPKLLIEDQRAPGEELVDV